MSADHDLGLQLPPEFIDQLADLVAARLAERVDTAERVWLSAPEAANYLNMKLDLLYKRTSAEAIPFHKDGGRLLFNRNELDAYMARNARGRAA
jgi:excisionase family DNA binding protein